MGHKTKVNGTVYEVTGGKCKVNGTGYSIKGGKTRVNGTGYDIKFSRLPTLAELLSTATVAYTSGRNSSSTATVSLSITDSIITLYLFVFCSGYMSINKRPKGGGFTRLCGNSDSYGNLCRKSGDYYYCHTKGGSSETKTYGAQIIAVNFNDSQYDEETIDAVLSNITFTGERAGRSSSSKALVSLSVSDDANKVVFAAGTKPGVVLLKPTTMFGAFVNGTSVLAESAPAVSTGSGSHTYYVTDTTDTTTYGGSIVVCQ